MLAQITQSKSLIVALLVSIFLQSCEVGVRTPVTEAQDVKLITEGDRTNLPTDSESTEQNLPVESGNSSMQGNNSICTLGEAADTTNDPDKALAQAFMSGEPSQEELITSTQSLLEEWNKLHASHTNTDKEQTAQIEEWIGSCIGHLKSLDPSTFTTRLGGYTGYRYLAHLELTTQTMRTHLGEYFQDIHQKVYHFDGYQGKPLRETLVYVLQNIKPDIWKKIDVNPLINLLVVLLGKLDTESAVFTTTTYEDHAPTLEAIYELLRIIRLLDSEAWDKYQREDKKAHNLYNNLKGKLDRIAGSVTEHYPVYYHVHLLKKTLAQYQQPLSELDRILAGIEGGLSVLKFASSCLSLKEALEGILELSSFSLDLVEKLSEVATPGGETRNTVVEIYEQFKTAFASDHTQDPYYIYHQALSLASHLAMREKDSVKAENLYKEIEDWLLKIATTKSLLGQDSFKALYYFAAHQLTLLALHHSCSSIRSKSVDKLYDLGTMWVEIADKDIVHKVLDSLALVQRQSQDLTDQDKAREYLEKFVKPSSKVSTYCSLFYYIKYSVTVKQVPFLVSSWLNGKNLEEKLETFSDCVPQKQAVSSSDLLFIDVQKRRLASERGPRCVLRYTYNHQYDKHYQLMQSVLNTDNTTFLKPCLLLHEQGNNKVVSRKSISIRDLLDSLRGDASRRILMVGDSGVGKTLLSYRMAYDWSKAPEFDDPSQERWGNRFNTAVYVLPARAITYDSNQDSVLSPDILIKAVIGEYFTYVLSAKTDVYDTWRRLIRDQLQKPSTLIIVDGISEMTNRAGKIFENDPEYPYKLIVTSRHALERSASIHFDLKADHMGLADDFRNNYVETRELKECFEFINKDIQRKAIMSIPINRNILYSMWSKFRESFEQQGHNNYSLGPCSLYRFFSDYVRDHVLNIPEADYQKLESIAFNNMKPQFNDELLESEYLKEGCMVGQGSAISDVLLRGTEIESESSVFKHLILQEYFAGRFLARKFVNSDPANSTKGLVEAFIRRHRVDQKYWNMFTFMVGEIFNLRSETMTQLDCSDNSSIIVDILNLFKDSESRRSYSKGLHTLSLLLRLANEWLTTLPLSREEKIERFKQIDQDLSITKSVHDWIDSECLSKNARYREEAINELVYTLQHTKAIISIIPKKTMGPLIKALRSRDSSKRKFSMNILLSLCQESSFFTDKICDQLQKVLDDKTIASKDIRCDILTGLVESCKKIPSSNSRVLRLLAEILESNSTIDTMSKDIVEKFRDELAAREELTITRELIDIYFGTYSQAIAKYFIRPRFTRAGVSLGKEGKNRLVLREGGISLIWEKPEEELDTLMRYIERGNQSGFGVRYSTSQQPIAA